MNSTVAGYLIVVGVMSLSSFVAYGWDKWRAIHGGRRIPEQTLHVLALLGGWPGAWWAQRQFRHKTQKISFRIVFWLVVVLHCGLVGVVVYRALGGNTKSHGRRAGECQRIWWPPRISNPVVVSDKTPGGFDSHPLPLGGRSKNISPKNLRT